MIHKATPKGNLVFTRFQPIDEKKLNPCVTGLQMVQPQMVWKGNGQFWERMEKLSKTKGEGMGKIKTYLILRLRDPNIRQP